MPGLEPAAGIMLRRPVAPCFALFSPRSSVPRQLSPHIDQGRGNGLHSLHQSLFLGMRHNYELTIGARYRDF